MDDFASPSSAADYFDQHTPGESLPPPLPLVPCWRCHKEATAGLAECPYCEARLSHPSHPSRTAATEVRPTDASPIVTLCVAFSLLLGVSIVQAVLMFALDDAPGDAATQRLYVMLIAEAIDTVVVLGSWSIMRGSLQPTDARLHHPLLAWSTAPFVLATALAINFGYHALLRSFVDWPREIDAAALPPAELALVIFAICVQPAIVEELFFRYLAIGALRDSMGNHAAVFVSSVMFGVAHVGSPLSMPVLVGLGFVLGYLRFFSGGLALPMLFHFAHNAVVLLAEHFDL
jgi:membrane protease YdiL (CAAX protease family)